MRVVLAAMLICFTPLMTFARIGDLEQTAKLQIISGSKGIIEQSLIIATDLSLKPSFDDLTFNISPSFAEVMSDVHDVSDAAEAIEALKGKVNKLPAQPPELEDVKGKLRRRLDAAQMALQLGLHQEAVGQMLEFINEVEEFQDTGLITDKEARSLIGRADWPLPNYAERIIAEIDKSKSERTVTTSLSAALSKLELTAKLDAGATRSPVPSKNRLDHVAQLKLALDLDRLKLTTNLSQIRQDFLRKSGKEEDELTETAEVIVVLSLSTFQITRTVKAKRSFFPNAIGEEIETTKIDEAITAVEILQLRVDDLEDVDVRVKKKLKDKLETVRKNLQKRRGDLAVEHLLDFIELVQQMRRDRRIPKSSDANWLMEKVRVILPDKRSSALSFRTEALWDLNDVDLRFSAEHEHENFPTATVKNEHAIMLKAEASKNIQDLTLTGLVERTGSIFPNEHKNDRSANRFRIKAQLNLVDLVLSASLEQKETVYPNAAKENHTYRKIEFQARHFHQGLVLVASLEHRKTVYPNTPVNNEVVYKLDLEVKLPLLNNLEFVLSSGLADECFPNAPADDKLSVAVGAVLKASF